MLIMDNSPTVLQHGTFTSGFQQHQIPLETAHVEGNLVTFF